MTAQPYAGAIIVAVSWYAIEDRRLLRQMAKTEALVQRYRAKLDMAESHEPRPGQKDAQKPANVTGGSHDNRAGGS